MCQGAVPVPESAAEEAAATGSSKGFVPQVEPIWSYQQTFVLGVSDVQVRLPKFKDHVMLSFITLTLQTGNPKFLSI